jgi:hypothetical protein
VCACTPTAPSGDSSDPSLASISSLFYSLYVLQPFRCERAVGNPLVSACFQADPVCLGGLTCLQASRVGFSVLDGIENGGKTSISIPYLVIGCFAYAFNFILLLFLDIHWRDVMNASNSKKSRQNWAGFVLISVAFIIAVVACKWVFGSRLSARRCVGCACVVVGAFVASGVMPAMSRDTCVLPAVSVADYIRNHDAGHSYAEFAIDLIFILISLRYMWASLRIYRKIRQSGITEGVILRAVITFVGTASCRGLAGVLKGGDRTSCACVAVIMASAAVLMVIRTAVDLYYSVNNEPAMVWWWYALIEWLPDVPPCFGYMYLMWGSEHVREDILGTPMCSAFSTIAPRVFPCP